MVLGWELERYLLVWENVKAELKRIGQKQEWLASEAELNFRTLQGWISKGIMCQADELGRIARALGTSSEALLGFPIRNEWEHEHRAFLSDLKMLTPDQLDTLITLAHVQAEKIRESLKHA